MAGPHAGAVVVTQAAPGAAASLANARCALHLGHRRAVYPEQRRRHILSRRRLAVLDLRKSGSPGSRAVNSRTDRIPA